MARKTFVAMGILFLAQIAAAQSTWQSSKLSDSGWWGPWDWEDAPTYSLAISPDGSTVVVGGYGSGAARVFARNGGAWSRQPDIPIPSDFTGGDTGSDHNGSDFPSSVAISAEGTVIVGCDLDSEDNGAAWVYTRSGDSWVQQGPKLVGSTGTPTSPEQGYSVAISADGNTAIVGAPWYGGYNGAAWVFTRTGGAWSKQAGALQGTPFGSTQPLQGSAVALSADGNTAVLAGYGDSHGTPTAWVFTRSGGAWSQQGPPLSGSDVVTPSYSGKSVAISGDGNTIILGGPWDNSEVGAAWVFARSAGVWSQQGPKLVGTGAVGSANQGTSVALSSDGNTAIVGGPGDDSGTGATWVFTRTGGVWSENGPKLVGGGAAGQAGEGTWVSVSADGRTFASGGPGDGITGAAWAFSRPAFAGWVPAVAHTAGLNQTQWRSDLGLLNPGLAVATVQLRFSGGAGGASSTVQVPAGAQSMLTDVVAQLGVEGQGVLQVVADQTVKVTARTYNQSAPDAACIANGTHGQDYPVLAAGGGLAAGQSAYLPGLVQNAKYRTNIGLLSTDDGGATVLVELFDGAGGKLAEYNLSLAQGRWVQENQPFETKAGQTTLDRGYARVTVQAGSGVYAFASVIDDITNDPTTVAMQR